MGMLGSDFDPSRFGENRPIRSDYASSMQKMHSALAVEARRASVRKIKRKLDRAADLIAEARDIARTLHPRAYIYCEGSGKIYARTGEGADTTGADVFVTSKQSHFDAGGW